MSEDPFDFSDADLWRRVGFPLAMLAFSDGEVFKGHQLFINCHQMSSIVLRGV